jgi:hypothetical protein
MTNFRNIAIALTPALLAACSAASSPTSGSANAALKNAVAAEAGPDKNVADLPIGKGIVGNFDGARQFFIATKTDNVQITNDAGKQEIAKNCGLFDVVVSHPSNRYSMEMGSKGDISQSKGLKVCL